MNRTVLSLVAILAFQATGIGHAQEPTKAKSKLKVTFRSDKRKAKPKLRLKPSKTTNKPAASTTKRLSSQSKPSVQLKRIQITPGGKIDATNLTKQLEGSKRNAGTFRSPKLSETATSKRPSTKLNAASTTKRLGGKFQSPKLSDMATSKRPSTKLKASSTTKRFGGKFQAPKLSDMATSKRPSTKLNAASTTKRFGGKFQSPKLSDMATSKRPSTKLNAASTTKRFGGKFNAVNKTTGKSTSKLGGKTLGKGMAGLAAVGVGKSALDEMKNAKNDYKSGAISKSQYRKTQKKGLSEAAGKLYKLKKLNPASAVLNDVVGTDPISLGVDAALDLVNGTDNAKQSLKNVKKSWDKSLTKQVFTDPKGAGKRVVKGAKKVGEGVKTGAKKVGDGVKKGAKKVGNFFKKTFKSKKKKK